jgi:hypothetical protein
MPRRHGMIGVVLAAVLAACGATDDGVLSAPDPDGAAAGGGAAAGSCLAGDPDCLDESTGAPAEPIDDSAFDANLARRDAQDLLGATEADLAGRADVRTARRGDETVALTDDWRPGRKTVALDADGSGVYRVTEVVVELDEGTATFTAE